MNRKNIAHALQLVVPPYQPGLMSHTMAHDHKVAISTWTDQNIKNLASLLEFSTWDVEDTEVTLYPDACMKIFFECNPEELRATVIGVNFEPTKLKLKRNTTYFVLAPYSHLCMNLKLSPLELLNCQFDIKDVVSSNESPVFSQWERISTANSFEERVHIACETISRVLVKETYSPNLVEFCSIAMCCSPRTFKMSELQDYTGYSERYCREEFRKYFGISPKLYNRILRFQGAIKSLCKPEHDEVFKILEEYGYYDQSHFIKEIRSFTGESPLNFRSHFAAR